MDFTAWQKSQTDFTQGKKLAPRNMPLTLAVDTRRARTRVGRASTKSARWEGVYRPRIDASRHLLSSDLAPRSHLAPEMDFLAR